MLILSSRCVQYSGGEFRTRNLSEHLSLASLRERKEFLDQRQIRSKVRTIVAGRTHRGAAYSRGALYHLLNNHIYIGEVVHQGQAYTGQHQPIHTPTHAAEREAKSRHLKCTAGIRWREILARTGAYRNVSIPPRIES